MKEFSFKINGNPYKVNILNVEEERAEVEVNGTRYEVVLDKKPNVTKTPKLVRGKTPVHSGPMQPIVAKSKISAVTAPLPGLITQIMVKEGDHVSPDQTLLLMEAMKMENRVLAEISGTVKTIHVAVGDSVLQGQMVIELA